MFPLAAASALCFLLKRKSLLGRFFRSEDSSNQRLIKETLRLLILFKTVAKEFGL
jgi:hypothetical protein